jgi:hypothetical protein
MFDKSALFMQNKANFRNDKMNINTIVTMRYVNSDTWQSGKTKPIQTQFKAKQSQFWAKIKGVKAKTNPIQTQFDERPKMNAFAWIRSHTMVLLMLLADFTTLKGANQSQLGCNKLTCQLLSTQSPIISVLGYKFLKYSTDCFICPFCTSASQGFPAQSKCPDMAIRFDLWTFTEIFTLWRIELIALLSLFSAIILHGPGSVIVSTYFTL